MIEYWNAFWFAPESDIDLAVARIAILGYFLLFKLGDGAFDFAAWANARIRMQRYWQRPWLLRVVPVPFAGRRVQSMIASAYKVSILFGALGLFTQVSCAVAFVLGLYLLGIRHGLRIHHTVVPIHFCLLAFTVGPAGHALSLDSALAIPPLAEASPERCGWSLQLIRAVVSIIVFATGVAKLRHMRAQNGFVHAGNLADLCRLHDFPYFFVGPLVSLSAFLRRHPTLERFASLGTVTLELAFPLALFWPPAQWFMIPAFSGLIIGFRLFIGARFDFWLVVLLAAFVPWSTCWGAVRALF